MEELIKYFESIEARIAALEEKQETNEAVIASLEAEIDELKSLASAEPQVVEKVVEKIVEKPVEVIKEVIVEKPVQVPTPVAEPEVAETPEIPEPHPEPAKPEVASPNAALYGKAVNDIRQAISLGDRFLYQRELFGQNAELMQRTLTELDTLSSFEEAQNYISRFNWDTESPTYQQFVVTLHRRFG